MVGGLARGSLAGAIAFGGCSLILVACDLDLKPYVEPVEGGVPFTPSTGTSSSSSSGSSGQTITDGSTGEEAGTVIDGGLDAAAARKRVFVTSTVTAAGTLNGAAGANAFCNQRATAANLTGTYVAWISSNADPAINRITSNGPFFLVDQQTMVFPSKAAIPQGPLVMIDRDETNKLVPNPEGVWTGTQANGTAAGQNCNGFVPPTGLQGQAGSVKQRNAAWTQAGAELCATQLHVYCFERD